MKRPVFENGHYYHVYNRGVEKRDIFLEEADYRRFLFGLKEFNDVNSTINILRRFNEGSPTSFKAGKKDPLVEIICYCLMPNHFHLILKQLREGGISRFMQKLGVGHTHYFNQKNDRSGVLFQGKFKAILINKDNYLNYLIQYIHLNPLDLLKINWKEGKFGNIKKVKEFLKNYKWTNCKNYDKYNDFFDDFSTQNIDEIGSLTIE